MTRTRRTHPNRLRLESLEDRSVPATFNVTTTLDVVDPADGKLSLREAITKANTSAGADLINVPAGVFKIALGGTGDDDNVSGDFDVTGSVAIRGAGAGATIIDGQQIERVFDVFAASPGSIAVAFEKMTVRNGISPNHGGGILFANANLVVRDSAVTGNRASLSGGGISNGFAPGSGNVTLVRSTIARNTAGESGGGLSIMGATSVLTVNASTVRRNVTSGFGGGIDASTATVKLTHSTVSGNYANSSGGLVAATATLANSTVTGNTAAGATGGGLWANTATLTNCTVSGNHSNVNGGGIVGVTVKLTNSSVSGNTATIGDGGGLWVTTATLTDSTVSGNHANVHGGGILAMSSATLTHSTVSGNTAASDTGGGIRTGTLTVTSSTVSGNYAGSFGGGILATISATVTGSTVSDNHAASFGGGINAVTATITRSTVSGNTTADGGGGIAAGTATLTNSTVSGNTAKTTAGGIAATTATLLNCTVVENIAQTGGGLFHSPGGTFSLRNTIVALNLVGIGGSGRDVFGDFTSQGHNLIGDGTGGTGFVGTGDLVGTTANPFDPKLGPLANNGGPTKTHALLAGSKAIDAGDNAGALATDQRGFGFSRKKDGNIDGSAIVDIGAFER